jgi:hypothetical protein
VLVVVSPRTPADTLAVVASLDPTPSSLTILAEQGRGFPGALNSGIRAASSDRIGFLLSDDWLQPTAVEECLPYTEDIVSAGHTVYDTDGTTPLPLIRGVPSAEAYARLTTLESRARYLSHFFLFQRAALLAAGGLDETLGNTPGIDDYDLIWVLLERGASVKVVERSLYNYRDHTGERLTLGDPPAMLHTARRILQKHGMPEAEISERLAHSARWFGRPIQEVLRAEGRDPTRPAG